MGRRGGQKAGSPGRAGQSGPAAIVPAAAVSQDSQGHRRGSDGSAGKPQSMPRTGSDVGKWRPQDGARGSKRRQETGPRAAPPPPPTVAQDLWPTLGQSSGTGPVKPKHKDEAPEPVPASAPGPAGKKAERRPSQQGAKDAPPPEAEQAAPPTAPVPPQQNGTPEKPKSALQSRLYRAPGRPGGAALALSGGGMDGDDSRRNRGRRGRESSGRDSRQPILPPASIVPCQTTPAGTPSPRGSPPPDQTRRRGPPDTPGSWRDGWHGGAQQPPLPTACVLPPGRGPQPPSAQLLAPPVPPPMPDRGPAPGPGHPPGPHHTSCPPPGAPGGPLGHPGGPPPGHPGGPPPPGHPGLHPGGPPPPGHPGGPHPGGPPPQGHPPQPGHQGYPGHPPPGHPGGPPPPGHPGGPPPGHGPPPPGHPGGPPPPGHPGGPPPGHPGMQHPPSGHPSGPVPCMHGQYPHTVGPDCQPGMPPPDPRYGPPTAMPGPPPGQGPPPGYYEGWGQYPHDGPPPAQPSFVLREVAQLGHGAYGTIKLCERSPDKALVAVKRPVKRPGSCVRAELDAEAVVLRRLLHKHIVRLSGTMREQGRTVLVLEYADRGDLTNKLQPGGMDRAEVTRICAEIADALHYMHVNRFVHRDIKPANVLFVRAGRTDEVRLCDFGIATQVGWNAMIPREDCIIPAEKDLCYLSPEMLERAEHSFPSDVWALGCVLYQMSTGIAAFFTASKARTGSGMFLEYPPPRHCDRLVHDMLKMVASERPTAAEVVRRCGRTPQPYEPPLPAGPPPGCPPTGPPPGGPPPAGPACFGAAPPQAPYHPSSPSQWAPAGRHSPPAYSSESGVSSASPCSGAGRHYGDRASSPQMETDGASIGAQPWHPSTKGVNKHAQSWDPSAVGMNRRAQHFHPSQAGLNTGAKAFEPGTTPPRGNSPEPGESQ